MGNDKEQRHHKRHDGHDGSMAASTDVADAQTVSDDEAKRWQAESRRDKAKDAREHKHAEIHGTITTTTPGPTYCNITIRTDVQHVHDGDTGYIKHGDAMLDRFTVLSVDPSKHEVHALVYRTADELHGASEVIINPVSFPHMAQARPDLKARALKLEAIGKQTRITISMGHQQGVQVGMAGYLLASESGGYFAGSRFEVTQVKERTCLAMVDLIADEVTQHQHVMLNPSSVPSPSGR
jgi:hypothetical protein